MDSVTGRRRTRLKYAMCRGEQRTHDSDGGVEQFILDLGKEDLGFLFAGLIVAAEGEEVADFLVEALLGRPDLTDAGEEFVEVIPAARIFEALVVHDEAFDEVFLEMGGRPLAELGAAKAADAVADGEDEVEVVELCFVALSVGGSCQGFLDN